MAATPEVPLYRIDNIEIDSTQACIRRDGREVHVKPKTFRVMLHLFANRDRLVTKEELMDLFWKDAAVTDDALTQCIAELRRALGDNPRNPTYIKTIPRVGFRFVGAVNQEVVEGLPEPINRNPDALVHHRSSSFRKWPLVAGLLTVSVGSAALWNKLPWGSAPPAAGAKRVIAILRFENRPGLPDLDWLREGLPDMLETTLSRSGTLEIIPRNQVYAARNSPARGPQDPLELARASHAQIAVAGSFSKLGDHMRVDARVLDARSGALIAAESITLERQDDLLTQIDDLAARIARRIAPREHDRDRRALASLMTQNLEAYRAYSLGLEKAESFQTPDAIALFEKAVSLDPGFVMAHARIGYAYAVTDTDLARGRPYLEKAFRMSEKLTERDRRHILAWYAIANADYASAIRSFSELIREYPNDDEAYLRLATLLRGDSRHEEALELLRRANEIDPEDPKIYNATSAVYSEMGRHDDAVAMAQRYVQLSSDDANAYDSLGLAYQGGGYYDAAEESFSKALAFNPSYDVAAIHRAMLYSDTGRVKEAIRESLLVAGQAQKESWRGWSLAAYIAWRFGRLPEARSIAARGIQAEGTRIGDWNPAFIFVSSAKRTTSAEEFQIGRGARFGSRTVLFRLAYEDHVKGDTPRMLEHLHQLISIRPHWGESESYEDALADALMQLGRVDEAIVEYERALRVFPGMGMARFHLARAYQRKGRKMDAITQYQRFLELWSHADADLPELAEARALGSGFAREEGVAVPGFPQRRLP